MNANVKKLEEIEFVKRGRKRGDLNKRLCEFAQTSAEDDVLVLEFPTLDEAMHKQAQILNVCYREGLSLKVKRSGQEIYVMSNKVVI